MNTPFAELPETEVTNKATPLFLTPIDTEGKPILYKIIAQTAPLMREMEKRWTKPWINLIQGPRVFAAEHTHIAATYQLFWLLKKVEVAIVNAELMKQGRFPVNLVETLAFLKTYPEYLDVLDWGPYATASCVDWGFPGLGSSGPGPMSLAIHPSHPSLRTSGYWPSLGNKIMWSNSVILARTSELVSNDDEEFHGCCSHKRNEDL